MRTTSSVEANNMVLNENIINRGNFFTFAHDLRLEECLQFQNLRRCFESGGKPRDVRKKYKVSAICHILYFLIQFV